MTKRSPYRRRHTPEFKVECVRVMRERLATGLTLQRVSEEVEVGPDLLRQWAKQVASHYGGTRNGLITHWPKGIDKPGIREE